MSPTLRTVLVLAICGSLLPGCGGFLRTLPAEEPVPAVSVQEAAGELASDPDPFLLDVREKAEYDEAHIRGAVLVPNDQVAAKIAANDLFPDINGGRTPRKDQPILVYCRSGACGAAATRTLRGLGYLNARNVSGGITAWKGAGLPVESASPPR